MIENFDWPLLRTNLLDFWRTWHISVTSWCREYVFTGVYAAARQRWLGLVATMLAIGLWHGLTLNFVAWGLYHGLGIVATQWWSNSVLRRQRFSGAAGLAVSAAGWFVTFNFVIIGFAWTKEPDLASSLAVLRLLLTGATPDHVRSAVALHAVVARHRADRDLVRGAGLGDLLRDHRRGRRLPVLADVRWDARPR